MLVEELGRKRRRLIRGDVRSASRAAEDRVEVKVLSGICLVNSCEFESTFTGWRPAALPGSAERPA